jgi:DNA-directed RNA polymerase subunit RPC12/RpoP
MLIVGKDTTHLKRVTCPECASIIEYAYGEIKIIRSRDFTGREDHDRTLRCPACHFLILVE